MMLIRSRRVRSPSPRRRTVGMSFLISTSVRVRIGAMSPLGQQRTSAGWAGMSVWCHKPDFTRKYWMPTAGFLRPAPTAIV